MRADFLQNHIHIVHLPLEIGIGRIDNVQQHICQSRFLKRRRKRRHQLVRQIADETDCIRQNHARLVRQEQTPRRRIQRGKKLVFRQHVRLGQTVEQAGFARVGITDDGKGFQTTFHPRFAARGTLFFHLRQLFFQRRDFLPD